MGNGCFRTTDLSFLLRAWHGWKGISRLSSSISSLNKSISYGEFVEISQTKTGPCDQGNGWIYRLTAGIIVVGIKQTKGSLRESIVFCGREARLL